MMLAMLAKAPKKFVGGEGGPISTRSFSPDDIDNIVDRGRINRILSVCSCLEIPARISSQCYKCHAQT